MGDEIIQPINHLIVDDDDDDDDDGCLRGSSDVAPPQRRTVSGHQSQVSAMTGGTGGGGRRDGGASPSNPSQPRAPAGTLIGEHQIALRITDPGPKDRETRGTEILHEVFREFRQIARDLRAEDVLESAFQNVRDEYPSASSREEMVLIECTDDVAAWGIVDEAPTHAFAEDEVAAYGVAVKPKEALELYYTVWLKRIPRNPRERKAWVADVEERFCAWQLTEVAQFQSNEALENLRLAIQFVKKWMSSPEAGVTEQMIPGHLKLIQKGWNELKDATMPTQKEIDDMNDAQRTLPTEQRELPHPRECFQTLPTEKDARYDYIKRIRENYEIWKDTPVARQCRKNILLAFEKLLQHSTEWLGYTDTDQAITERTLKMFFGLLKERWNEFMDNTDKYKHVLNAGGVKRNRDDGGDDDSQGEGDQKKPRAVKTVDSTAAVASVESEAKPAQKAALPFNEINLELDDADFSQVSMPFPKEIDPNPLKADATKGLFGAVEQDSLAQVQHFVTQGATARGRDEFGETPLHRAAAVGKKEIIEHLRLWRADPWARSLAKELPLHIACWYGHADAAKFLLKQLGSVSLSDLLDGRGRTPLHLACHQGHFSVVRLLIDAFGQNAVNVRDNDRLSPRHYAVMGEHLELVQYLDGLGADRSDDGVFDPNSLHDACSTGRLGLVRWIAESTYADLEGKDSKGRTPLECAKVSGNTEVVAWIQECLHVDTTATDKI